MLDKQLSEAAWKAFAAKEGPYEDSALLKALSALARAEKSGPDEQIDALDAIEKQVGLLRKAHRGDKGLAAYLDAMEKASVKHRTACEQDRKTKATTEDAEEDSPALLTSKLIPLLRELRRGESVMPAMILLAGKDAAVLVARRSIAPTRSKLLKDYLGASGTAKVILADCLFEKNAHTFVLKGESAAGLAKKLRAALLAQTDLKLKVRVRGQDPNDVDEDGEDADAPGETPGTPGDGDGRYAERWAELEPQLLAALKAQHPEASKLRAVAEFAAGKAQSGDTVAALKALDTLAKLLSIPGGNQADAPKPVANPALTTALAGWKQARDAALLRLRDVAAEMKSDLQEDPADDIAREAELQTLAVMRQLTAEPSRTAQVNDLQVWLRDDEVVLTLDQEIGGLRTPLLAALETVRKALPPDAP